MRKHRWTAAFLLAAWTLAAQPAVAAFDAELSLHPDTKNYMTVEKPTPARDFVDHVGIYLRFIPPKGKNRVFPVFIDTKNYLTCPDSEQRWTLNRVAQVSNDRRSGVKVLGFFFDKPSCDKPTYHFEAVVADS